MTSFDLGSCARNGVRTPKRLRWPSWASSAQFCIAGRMSIPLRVTKINAPVVAVVDDDSHLNLKK